MEIFCTGNLTDRFSCRLKEAAVTEQTLSFEKAADEKFKHLTRNTPAEARLGVRLVLAVAVTGREKSLSESLSLLRFFYEESPTHIYKLI